ncbi:hypothetical protein Q5752_003384 [Cryptotrichosporon argae]
MNPIATPTSGESSSSPAATPPSSSTPARSGSSSSAAFIHHLHNDPSSHHITLPAASGRHASAPGFARHTLPDIAPSSKPTGGDVNQAATSHSPGSASTAPAAAAADYSDRRPSLSMGSGSGSGSSDSLRQFEQPVAGPSTARRASSRRHRPKTAPARPGETSGLAADQSPDPNGPRARFDDDDGQMLEGDGCIATFAEDEADRTGRTEALMALASSGDSSSSILLGRAGSLAPNASSLEPMLDPAAPRTTWKAFGTAYAMGRFDPHRVPNPPIAEGSPSDVPSAQSSPGRASKPLHISTVSPVGLLRKPTSQGSSSINSGSGSGSTLASSVSSAPALPILPGEPKSAGLSSVASARELASRTKAFELENLPSRAAAAPPPRPDQLALPNFSFAAATVRMASSNLREADLSPLGMPSPERELLDPMAGIMSNKSSAVSTLREGASSDPGSSRFHLGRSMSSTVTSSVSHPDFLPTIQASPVTTPDVSPYRRGGVPPASRVPAATAPVEKVVEIEAATDYFGAASPSHSSNEPTPQPALPTVRRLSAEPTVQAGPPAAEPRRAPSPDRPQRIPPVATANELGQLYDELGWLPAPMPPNELARRKALYRFNILHTNPDSNFDRIAHMAKLVFNTKIVLLALIDGEQQWHKSHTGLGSETASRISSFCSHSVLATNNPQVIGPPYIRFYAGAPLRTSDGFNLGSLCIIDDKPRPEFTPRSRLILKEFAAVAMRELELWRDKLQLRVRDRIQTSMEQFTRECLEIDDKPEDKTGDSPAEQAARMDQVYARAAKLVCNTLDLDGCVILDISQFEGVQATDANGARRTVYKANPYDEFDESPVTEQRDGFGPVNAFPVLATTPTSVPTRPLTAVEHEKLSEFLGEHRDGRIFENIAPSWIRYMFPSALKYGMVVPVYGVDQQPFAMICAYTLDKGKQFLEGYELQFLRAIGVIILSAVLRRRMVLADKAKSILISSVSHELRTPLHGILAAAELLQDTKLDPTQISYLKTVQTCGSSLIETVNHVLDFTKLTGSAKGASKDARGVVDLATLVEQTVEGCWIGQRARTMHGDSEIGSFYAPDAQRLPSKSERETLGDALAGVETVVDIAQRERGWRVRCERGGLRRVLMNLVGNSLKFTQEGYIQITLRELPHEPDSKVIPVEMAVIDTGKGIGKDFLKEQLFHPFSQENPLQTGTGLGLAIVNSIVRSESVNGKVDVWSSEGKGTEIRVSFDVEVIDDDNASDASSISSFVSSEAPIGRGHKIALLGFDPDHRGQVLTQEVLASYATSWMFDVVADPADADLLVVNELTMKDPLLADAGAKPFVLIHAQRTGAATDVTKAIQRAGGYGHAVYKPVGPAGFRRALRAALQWLETGEGGVAAAFDTPTDERERPVLPRGESGESGVSGASGESNESNQTVSEYTHARASARPPLAHIASSTSTFSFASTEADVRAPLSRRRSEDAKQAHAPSRPSLAPRGVTYHAPSPLGLDAETGAGTNPRSGAGGPGTSRGGTPTGSATSSASPRSQTSTLSTVSLGEGGVMLKAATVPSEAPRRARKPRVMVVEDNLINRRVLGAYLAKKGAEFAEAHDGQAGVTLFEQTDPNYWDIILMDITMPVMDGYAATRAIRAVEDARRHNSARARATPALPRPDLATPAGLVAPVADPMAAAASASASASAVKFDKFDAREREHESERRGVVIGGGSIGGVKVDKGYVPSPRAVQQRTKIFALTGLATADDKRRAFGSGVDGYLVKPVSLASLDVIFQQIGF